MNAYWHIVLCPHGDKCERFTVGGSASRVQALAILYRERRMSPGLTFTLEVV